MRRYPAFCRRQNRKGPGEKPLGPFALLAAEHQVFRHAAHVLFAVDLIFVFLNGSAHLFWKLLLSIPMSQKAVGQAGDAVGLASPQKYGNKKIHPER